ncbi:hypothetical protein [Kitasatospora aureofaciens]|uniref:hypothetical protein n=1 Tax=Kitasatospora aureofaciens TaxID=1894 RepID=UPI0005266191|nr:hypothetical protein [Kitasatospora aureofaciens]
MKPGSHENDGTILGGHAVVTAGEHATEHAVPLITSRPPHPPFQQTRTIEPGEPVPGPPYVIRPTHHEQAGLVIAEDKLGVNDAPPAMGAVHVRAGPRRVRIRSDKGLSLRLVRPGEQLELPRRSGSPRSRCT